MCHYRLVLDEERAWTEEHIDSVALKHFPNIDRMAALKRPILFSNWLTKVCVIIIRVCVSMHGFLPLSFIATLKT